MGLLDRIAAGMTSRDLVPRDESRFAVDQWLSNYLLPANEFGYNSHAYPFGLNQTLVADRAREISTTLPGYLGALRMCPPAFASQMFRAMVLSQARFTFRNNRLSRTPGRLFGSQALTPLEKPWRNATTGELLARMEWHAGLAGNAYVTNRPIRDRGASTDRLRVLRPDWTVIVYGSEQEPEDAAYALDGEVIGYAYCNGGIMVGRNKTTTLLPDEVAHWSPIPDPESAGIGMSWITAAVREIQGDRAATDHKLQFFANAGTPNMVVKGLTAQSKEAFAELVDMMESRHAGVRNAYKTLYLTAGADATVVGANLQQMDFKNTQGAGETRITQLSRVHPVLLGASEGLQGSSLNAGNFGAARRMFADSWLYPMLQDVAAALSPLIKVPSDAELWTTTSDMPILREDAKDAAEIEQIKASTINGHITAGFTPESAVAAVDGQDVKLLVHTGLISVQLQPPGAPPPTAGPAPTDDKPKPKPGPGGAGPKASADRADRFVSDGLDLRHLPGKHNQLDHAGKHGKHKGGKSTSLAKKLFLQQIAQALRDRDALEAAPIKLSRDGHFERGVAAGATDLDPQALAMYRGDFYTRINNGLRTNTIEQDAEAAWAAHGIFLAMEHSRLSKPVVVHRGVKNLAMFGDIDPHQSLVGLEYVDPAPQSSTVDKNVAIEYLTLDKGSGLTSTENRALLNIVYPPGVGAVQLSDYGPPPLPDHERPVEEEAELLMQPQVPAMGASLPRLRTYVVGDHVVNGLRELDVVVVIDDGDPVG